jgi:hypothetical protein
MSVCVVHLDTDPYVFSGLPDPDPSLFCTDPDLDPHPFINKQKSKKNLNFHYFVTFYYYLSMKTDVNVPSKNTQ